MTRTEECERAFKGGVLVGALASMLGTWFAVFTLLAVLGGDWGIYIAGVWSGFCIFILGVIVWDTVEDRRWNQARKKAGYGH